MKKSHKKAQTVKTKLLKFFLYEKQYRFAATESFCNSDVFAVTRSGYTIEAEVKVHRSDLQSEIKKINIAKERPSPLFDRSNLQEFKVCKHSNFLFPEVEESVFFDTFKPNSYYFGVTPDLACLAVDAVKETPYGVLVVDETVKTVVPATKIHKNKLSQENLEKVMRRVCNENVMLREKIGWV